MEEGEQQEGRVVVPRWARKLSKQGLELCQQKILEGLTNKEVNAALADAGHPTLHRTTLNAMRKRRKMRVLMEQRYLELSQISHVEPTDVIMRVRRMAQEIEKRMDGRVGDDMGDIRAPVSAQAYCMMAKDVLVLYSYIESRMKALLPPKNYHNANAPMGAIGAADGLSALPIARQHPQLSQAALLHTIADELERYLESGEFEGVVEAEFKSEEGADG